MKGIFLAALGVVLSCTQSMAGDLKFTDRQRMSYSFNGIDGHLYIDGAFKDNPKSLVSIILGCSEDKATAGVSFENLEPAQLEEQDQAGLSTLSIGEVSFEVPALASGNQSLLYGSQVGSMIGPIIKQIYDRGEVAPRIEVKRNDGSRRYVIALTGPYVDSVFVSKDKAAFLDREKIREQVGQFYQLCSIWWRQ